MVNFKLNKGRLVASLALGLTFTILMSLACFDASCQQIRNNVLRLHILANSDSTADQQIKLKVRDALLEEFEGLFEGTDNLNQAQKLAENNLERLEQVANSVLAKEGANYSAKAVVAPSDFNTRVYDDYTLPAGEYMAVRVLLGDGEGQNWWCVCFPNLCIGSASQKDNDASFGKQEQQVVKGGEKYKVKFKIVEIYEKIKTKLK